MHDALLRRLQDEGDALRARVAELESQLGRARDEAGLQQQLLLQMADLVSRILPFHRAETERMQGLVRFREAVIHSAAEGICVYHSVPAFPHVAFTIWNERMTQITGYTMAVINERGWCETLFPDPEARQRARLRMERAQAGDHLRGEEWGLTDKDGRARVVAISTSRVDGEDGTQHVVALLHDVTERHQAEQPLRDCVQHAPHVAIRGFDADGRVQIWNQGAEKVFGWPAAEAVGKTLDQLSHTPQEAIAFRALLRRILQTGAAIPPGESPFRRRDGSAGVCLSTLFPIPSPDGRPVVVGMDVDVTERKGAEQERLRLQHKQMQAQKLESLATFAGGVAHSFNNLLTAVLGYAELALKEMPAGTPATEYIDQSMLAARRAAELTSQMLSYTGKACLAAEPVNLSALVQEMALLLKKTVAGKASLALDCPTGLPPIEADLLQLRQVILSLVTNAGEALAGRRGEVRVRTGVRHLVKADLESSLVSDLEPGRYVFVEVTDTGCGLDAVTLEKVFDPFFTTKFTGRGLSLAAVLGIVRSHRGLIQVRSTPDTGTTLSVYFPVNKPLPAESEGGKAGTILVVEDERNVRELARVLLEQVGYRVVLAEDGQAGLEEFDRLAGQVDGVLLDLTMPRQNGLQVLATLRQRAPQLPVVLMTGYSTQGLADQINDPWARLVQKPFTAETLLDALDAARRGAGATPRAERGQDAEPGSPG